MLKALANKQTTILGAIVAVFIALGQVPDLAQYTGVLNSLAGVATAVGLLLAKDGKTGSPPGSTS